MKRLWILWLVVLYAGHLFAQSPKVYVFLPSNIRPHIMKQVLSEACPDIEFTVFGRYREFQARIDESPPDAIISLEPVIARHTAAVPILQGELDGEVAERYVLLSRDQPVDLARVKERVIGVFDLLGRSQMNKFLSSKLNVAEVKRVRTVTKLEDLLSLLQFRDADAILVPESKVTYYRSRTVMTLEITRLEDVTIGLPVVAALNADPSMMQTITQTLTQAVQDLEKTLGVEKWVQP